MKKKYLFSTKPWVYLIELPFILLFLICLKYNGATEATFKLYPLMILLVGMMIFTVIYFFRVVTISYSEVRTRGFFSSKDSAVINKDKTLILTMHPRKIIRVALFGNDGMPPMYGGLDESIETYLFRAKAVGGRRTVKSVLKYFAIPDEDAEAALAEDKFEREYKDIIFTVEKREDIREIRIKFKETI